MRIVGQNLDEIVVDKNPGTDDMIVLKNPIKKYGIIALRGTDNGADMLENLNLLKDSKPSNERS